MIVNFSRLIGTTRIISALGYFSVVKKHIRLVEPLITHKTASFCCYTTATPSSMNLSSVIHYLEEDAPQHLSEDWDNVGLLVEPTGPHAVQKILLTNDLTESVCQEAIETRSNLIISYHPPIFSPLKRLTQKSVKERIIIKCIENRIAVYSPHTIYDNAVDGVNRWIIGAFKAYQLNNIRPIHQKYETCALQSATHRLELRVSAKADILINDIKDVLFNEVAQTLEFPKSMHTSHFLDENREEKVLIVLLLDEDRLTKITDLLDIYPEILRDSCTTKLAPLPLPGCGSGLICSINGQLKVSDAVKCVKDYFQLPHVRLALGSGKTMDSLIGSVAVFAGSGKGGLSGCKADLFLTGELSHHDVLALTEQGTSLILTEHSNSERGFLTVLKDRLERKFEKTGVNFIISQNDRDPLTVV